MIEFLTGEALFQTHDNLEHLAMMERVFGKIPDRMVDEAHKHAVNNAKKKESVIICGALSWP